MPRVALDCEGIYESLFFEVDYHTLPLVVHRKTVVAIYGKTLRRAIYLHILGQKVGYVGKYLSLAENSLLCRCGADAEQ